jgi:hypothetical protein
LKWFGLFVNWAKYFDFLRGSWRFRYFGICGLFPVFLGFYARSVPVSSGNMRGFCGENMWLRVADCMANVDWRRFLRVESILVTATF